MSSQSQSQDSSSYPHALFQHAYRPPKSNVDKTNQPGKRPAAQVDVLDPRPVDDVYADGREYRGSGKLDGKVAIITGGDSGIGRSTAILFAIEGADSLITYLPIQEGEKRDAEDVQKYVKEKTGGKRRVEILGVDLKEEKNNITVVDECIKKFGRLDILVNNAAQQLENHDITTLKSKQWEEVFQLNIHSYFYLSKAAIPHLNPGSSIINVTSINAFVGRPDLLDYTSTKGAIVSFTKGLSNQILSEKKIRVNGVAPGPIWTPLVPSTFEKGTFEGTNSNPIGRIGQPVEVATSLVFLAGPDSSFMSGQILHPNGGVPI